MNQEQRPSPQKRMDEGIMNFGTLLALGVSLGFVADLIFGTKMFLSLGLLTATILRLAYEKRQDQKGAGVGLAIAIAALLIFILVWWKIL